MFEQCCQQICEYNIQLLINLSVFDKTLPTITEQQSDAQLVTIEELSDEQENTDHYEHVSSNGGDCVLSNGPLMNGK